MVQLAAVHAAVAEGFALDEILDVEGLPQWAWFEAEVSWKARLVESEEVMAAYAEELGHQQDRLGRRVEPLEEDLGAWIAFLKFYQTHADPFDLLDALGLGFNDMSRLGRIWAKRFETDDKLAKRAAKLSLKIDGRVEQGDRVRLPPIEVAPAELSPSPAAGTFQVESEAADAPQLPESTPVLGLDQYASLSADLRVADEDDRDAVLARYGIDARHAVAIDEAWRFRLDSDRELRSDFRVLVGHYEQSARMRKASAASLPKHHEVPKATPMASFFAPLPIEAPPESLPLPQVGTAPGVVMAHTHALPFAGRVASMPRVADKLPPRPPRREGDIDATTDVIPALLDSEVMPFEGEAQTGEPAVEEDNLDGTMMLGAITFDDEDVLPFSGNTTPPPITPASFGGSLSESLPLPLVDLVVSLSDADVVSLDGSLDMTSGYVLPLSDDDVLPFSDLDTTANFKALEIDEDPLPFRAPEPSPGPSHKATGGASESASHDADLDETTALGVKAFDIERDPGTAEDIDSTTLLTALDLGLEEPDAADEPETPGAPPSLSLEQLASLHAELAVHPHDAAAIRGRYRLPTLADQQRLEAYWHARFASHPQEHATYHHKFNAFRSWLLSHPRS